MIGIYKMGDYYGSNKTSWREIILEHIRKILESSRTEWRGGFWQETGNNPITRTYIFDTRETFINGVLSLSDVLLPFFDDEMKEAHSQYEKDVENIPEEIIEELRNRIIKKYNDSVKNYKKNQTLYDRPNKEECKRKLNELIVSKEQEQYLTQTKSLEYARVLFQNLNLLLRRIDYLKSAVYEEDEE